VGEAHSPAPENHTQTLRFNDRAPGLRVSGIVPYGAVEILHVKRHSVGVTVSYRDDSGRTDQCTLLPGHEPSLRLDKTRPYTFDGEGTLFRLAVEALRIRMAALFDDMLAVGTSDLEPLPHQIRAVYGELLPRTPLRFLLADDPGAGKTIMAGLYIKELALRGDLERCLVVAPGALVEQWRDELADSST